MFKFQDLSFLNGSFLDSLRRQAKKGATSFADFDIYPYLSKKKYLFSTKPIIVCNKLSHYELVVADGTVTLSCPFKGSIWAKRVKILCEQPLPLQICASGIIAFSPCTKMRILENSPLISVGEWGLNAVKTYPEVIEGVTTPHGFTVLHLAALQAIAPDQLQRELSKLTESEIKEMLTKRLTEFPDIVEDVIMQSMPRGLDIDSFKRIIMFRTPIELAEILGSMFLYNYTDLYCPALYIFIESVKRVRFPNAV